MGKRNKLAKVLEVMGDNGLKLITMHCKAQFFSDGRKGHANRYSVAKSLRERTHLAVAVNDEIDNGYLEGLLFCSSESSQVVI